MTVEELFTKFRENGIDNEEKALKKLLKRAVDTNKFQYVKRNGKIVGFFSWEKVVYVNSLVMFSKDKCNVKKEVIGFIRDNNTDSDTIYWKNQKKDVCKMFKLRRF